MKESFVKDSLANLIEALATLYQFQRTIDVINAKEKFNKRESDYPSVDESGGENLQRANGLRQSQTLAKPSQLVELETDLEEY